jgi:hypothetical protein
MEIFGVRLMGNGFFIKVLVAVCVLVFLGQLVVAQTIAPSRELLAPLGMTTAFAALLAYFFERWMWRWCGISLIVKRPHLSGTWEGVILSDWVNPEKNSKLPQIATIMSVSQTATTLYLRQFTEESMSITTNASLQTEPDDTHVVVATYRNDPRAEVRHRSEIHYGALRLRIEGFDELVGEYWTDRKTRGELRLKRISRKKCNSFTDGEKLAAKIASRK